jgi:hypothetical protein
VPAPSSFPLPYFAQAILFVDLSNYWIFDLFAFAACQKKKQET